MAPKTSWCECESKTTTQEKTLSINVCVGKCNFALSVAAAVHVWMQDVGLQHIHFRPPVAPPKIRLERHVGAARRHASVEVSKTLRRRNRSSGNKVYWVLSIGVWVVRRKNKSFICLSLQFPVHNDGVLKKKKN